MDRQSQNAMEDDEELTDDRGNQGDGDDAVFDAIHVRRFQIDGNIGDFAGMGSLDHTAGGIVDDIN